MCGTSSLLPGKATEYLREGSLKKKKDLSHKGASIPSRPTLSVLNPLRPVVAGNPVKPVLRRPLKPIQSIRHSKPEQSRTHTKSLQPIGSVKLSSNKPVDRKPVGSVNRPVGVNGRQRGPQPRHRAKPILMENKSVSSNVAPSLVHSGASSAVESTPTDKRIPVSVSLQGMTQTIAPGTESLHGAVPMTPSLLAKELEKELARTCTKKR